MHELTECLQSAFLIAHISLFSLLFFTVDCFIYLTVDCFIYLHTGGIMDTTTPTDTATTDIANSYGYGTVITDRQTKTGGQQPTNSSGVRCTEQ